MRRSVVQRSASLGVVANWAPLGSLPGHLSDVAAYGVRIATVWQAVAQMRDRYGDAKDTIIGASTDKATAQDLQQLT